MAVIILPPQKMENDPQILSQIFHPQTIPFFTQTLMPTKKWKDTHKNSNPDTQQDF